MSQSQSVHAPAAVLGGLGNLVGALDGGGSESVIRGAIAAIERALGEAESEAAMLLDLREQTESQLHDAKARGAGLSEAAVAAIETCRDDVAERAVAEQLDLEGLAAVLERSLAGLARRECELEGYLAALAAHKYELEAGLAAYRQAREAAVAVHP